MTTNQPRAHQLTGPQLEIVRMLGDSDPKDVPKALTYLPTDVYSSPERFELEKQRLFRGRPVPIEVSVALPEPRMHVIKSDYGVPVLLTRDADGVMHAFLNVCTHRCIQLSQEKDPKSGGLITCPYHAWTFNLKGDLVGVPREEVFPGLDRTKHKLVPLECLEAGGLIWVNLDPASQADFSLVTDGIAAEFDALGLGEQTIYKKARFELATNWKLVHDAFLENYHIARLHSKSLGSMFVDRSTACVEIGPHILQSSGRVGYRAEERSKVATFEEFRDLGVFSYTVLAGALVITSPIYINVMLFAPQAHNKTVINYYMLLDRMPVTEAEIARCEKSVDLMVRITTEEDFWVSELGTLGTAAGAIKQMVIGGMEQDIGRFHRNIAQVLGS